MAETQREAADALSTDQRVRTGTGDSRNNAESPDNREPEHDRNSRTGVEEVQAHNGDVQGNRQDDRPPHLNKRQVDTPARPAEESHLEDSSRAKMSTAMRESLSDTGSQPVGQPYTTFEQVQAVPKCMPQGLIPSTRTTLHLELPDFRGPGSRVFVWWGSGFDL